MREVREAMRSIFGVKFQFLLESIASMILYRTLIVATKPKGSCFPFPSCTIQQLLQFQHQKGVLSSSKAFFTQTDVFFSLVVA